MTIACKKFILLLPIFCPMCLWDWTPRGHSHAMGDSGHRQFARSISVFFNGSPERERGGFAFRYTTPYSKFQIFIRNGTPSACSLLHAPLSHSQISSHAVEDLCQ